MANFGTLEALALRHPRAASEKSIEVAQAAPQPQKAAKDNYVPPRQTEWECVDWPLTIFKCFMKSAKEALQSPPAAQSKPAPAQLTSVPNCTDYPFGVVKCK